MGARGPWRRLTRRRGWLWQHAVWGWPSTVVDRQDNSATTKDFARRLPPMVARTVSLYVVGRWGVGVSAFGGAEGGIVGAEALSSSTAKILSPNAAQLPKPSSMAWISAMTVSMQVKRGAAYASICSATLSSSWLLCLSSASAFDDEVIAHLADSWQRRSLALSANALSRAAARHCLLASSASAFSCAAARRHLLALSANALSHVAISWRYRSSASDFSAKMALRGAARRAHSA